jgi:imidazolonepropionase-like amidohydrolase
MAYWLTGARVVDGTGRDPVDAVDIEIDGGMIVSLGKAPAGADAIDCTGLTITPGLIDAHVHFGLSSDINKSLRHDLSVAELAADTFANIEQTLDAGFTTVRDTGGIDGGVVGVVTAGKVRGPHILCAGPIQCQTGGHGHFAAPWEATDMWCTHDIPGLRGLALLSDGPEEMRKNVRETFRRGAHFIKMCVTGGVVSTHDKLTDTQLTVEEIAVAVAEANARGTYVTVHAHNNAGVRNAITGGVKCIEHGSEIDEEMAALMAAKGVAHVPTLAVVAALEADASAAGLPASIADRLGYVKKGMTDGLLASRAAGVRVGSGSDLIGPDQTGRAYELVLRSEIETPMLALQSATSINADILGVGDVTGTIEVGKRADLVAFASDPLENPKVFADRDEVVLVIKAGDVAKDRR